MLHIGTPPSDEVATVAADTDASATARRGDVAAAWRGDDPVHVVVSGGPAAAAQRRSALSASPHRNISVAAFTSSQGSAAAASA